MKTLFVKFDNTSLRLLPTKPKSEKLGAQHVIVKYRYFYFIFIFLLQHTKRRHLQKYENDTSTIHYLLYNYLSYSQYNTIQYNTIQYNTYASYKFDTVYYLQHLHYLQYNTYGTYNTIFVLLTVKYIFLTYNTSIILLY